MQQTGQRHLVIHVQVFSVSNLLDSMSEKWFLTAFLNEFEFCL